MSSCNHCLTPADTKSKLSSTTGPPVADPTLYRSLAGALQYLTFTSTDICYVVQQVCLLMHDPREPHMAALKRILRYIRGTLDHELLLSPNLDLSLVAYSNAGGWVVVLTLVFRHQAIAFSSATTSSLGLPNDRSPLLGLVLRLNIELSQMLSPKQLGYTTYFLCCFALFRNPPLSIVTTSVPSTYPIILFNTVAQNMWKLKIDIHFVRDKVALGHIRVLHVPSAYQFADIITKGLPTQLFQ
ncbi:PREDICTED: uncharacterized protein LOC105966421 [Erythranthe guttata]|uniref:uncharacterized protein LOC105966421 n=1 Tax=Erythranthe guttata TaxID=4155 RepID=UPI00064D95FF|nr:PREDICTED: uncharacterized protein LOC105966421 [Erythranthe guttata]|eukprot:XP_012846428.1 PREDICTED: uncharacterized protein LOC105966421 [Erythranthe guttata]